MGEGESASGNVLSGQRGGGRPQKTFRKTSEGSDNSSWSELVSLRSSSEYRLVREGDKEDGVMDAGGRDDGGEVLL